MTKMRFRPLFFTWAFTWVFWFLFAVGAQASEPNPTVSLKKTLTGRLDGNTLKNENALKQQIEIDAKEWSENSLLFAQNCALDPNKSQLCTLILSQISKETEGQTTSKIDLKDALDLTETVKNRKWGELKTIPYDLARVMTKRMTSESYALVSDSLRDRGNNASCLDPYLSLSLAVKGEEFFPEQKSRDRVRFHYQTAMRCSDSGTKMSRERLDLARYRFSLLSIWENKCDEALPLLRAIHEKRESDFFSRALYWDAQCTLKTGNHLLYTVLINRLRRLSPMSFHALISSSKNARQPSAMVHTSETEVLFRSEKKPELNPWLIAIERFLARGKMRDVMKVFAATRDTFEGAEPGVQLFAATLAKRTRDTLSQFRILSNLFQSEPKAMTPATLEMFFPLEKYLSIKNQNSRTDPLLITALIRQESGFVANARSPAGALGLMQVMPQTARGIARVSKKGLMNPNTNLRVGTKFLDQLIRRFDGNLDLAMAAYNAGPMNVESWLRRYPVADRMLFLDLIPFSETWKYVALIQRNYFWYTALYDSPTR